MKMTPPKNLGIRSIDDFISSAQFIFKLENKKEINFILDLSKMQSICLLGQLLLYKFISYTVEHKCFIKPEINFGKNKKIINIEVNISY